MSQENRRGLTGNPHAFYTGSMANETQEGGLVLPGTYVTQKKYEAALLNEPSKEVSPPSPAAEQNGGVAELVAVIDRGQKDLAGQVAALRQENAYLLQTLIPAQNEQLSTVVLRLLEEQRRQQEELLARIGLVGRTEAVSTDQSPGMPSQAEPQVFTNEQLGDEDEEDNQAELGLARPEIGRNPERRRKGTISYELGESIDIVLDPEEEDREDSERKRRVHAQQVKRFVEEVVGCERAHRLRLTDSTKEILEDFVGIDTRTAPLDEIAQKVEVLKEQVDIQKFFDSLPPMGEIPQSDEHLLKKLIEGDISDKGFDFAIDGEHPLFDVYTGRYNPANIVRFLRGQVNVLRDDTFKSSSPYDYLRGIGFYVGNREISMGQIYQNTNFYGRREFVLSGDEEKGRFGGRVDYHRRPGEDLGLKDLINDYLWGDEKWAALCDKRRKSADQEKTALFALSDFTVEKDNPGNPGWVALANMPLSEEYEQGSSGEGTLGVMFRKGWLAYLYITSMTIPDNMIDDGGKGKKKDPNQFPKEGDHQVRLFRKVLGKLVVRGADGKEVENPTREQKAKASSTEQYGPGVDAYFEALMGGAFMAIEPIKAAYYDEVKNQLREVQDESKKRKAAAALRKIESGNISRITLRSIPSFDEVGLPEAAKKAVVERLFREAKAYCDLQVSVLSERDDDDGKSLLTPYQNASKVFTSAAGPDQPLSYEEFKRKVFATKDQIDYDTEDFTFNAIGVLGYTRKDMNPFSVPHKDPLIRSLQHDAIIEGIIASDEGVKINDVDKTRLSGIVYDSIWWSGIWEEGDIDSIFKGRETHFDVAMMSRVLEGRGAPTMMNFPGIRSLLLGYSDFLLLSPSGQNNFHISLREYLQGGEGMDVNPWKYGRGYFFPENAERVYATDVLKNIERVYDGLTKGFSNPVKKTEQLAAYGTGNLVAHIDPSAVREFMGETLGGFNPLLNTHFKDIVRKKRIYYADTEYTTDGSSVKVYGAKESPIIERWFDDEVLAVRAVIARGDRPEKENLARAVTAYLFRKAAEEAGAFLDPNTLATFQRAIAAVGQRIPLKGQEIVTDYGSRRRGIRETLLTPDEVERLLDNRLIARAIKEKGKVAYKVKVDPEEQLDPDGAGAPSVTGWWKRRG